MPFDLMRGFQVGQAIAGQGTTAPFVRQLLERANQIGLVREQARAQVGAAVATEAATMPLEVAKAGAIEKAKAEADPFKRLITRQLEGQEGGFALPSDALATGFTSEGNIQFESPSAKAQLTAATEQGKTREQVGGTATSLRENLLRLRQLSRQIPAPKPGTAPFGRLSLRTQRFFGTQPQLGELQNTARSMAGELARIIGQEPSGRLSDQDIQRQLDRVLNMGVGTEQERLLAISGLVTALNKNPKVLDTIGFTSPLSAMTGEELLSARKLEGRPGGQIGRIADGTLVVHYADGSEEPID